MEEAIALVVHLSGIKITFEPKNETAKANEISGDPDYDRRMLTEDK